MKNKLITAIFMIAFICFSSSMVSADYPTGDLLYSDDIVAGLEVEWDVTASEGTGEFDDITDYLYIDTDFPSVGDKLKLVVTEDPDTAIGSWYDLYLNDVLVADPSNISLAYASYYMYFGPTSFITPVKYDNATGIYDLYEQLYEEWKPHFSSVDQYVSNPTQIYDVDYETYGYYDGETFSVGLNYDVSAYFFYPDGREGHEHIQYSMGNTVDVETGILQEAHGWIDVYSYMKYTNGTLDVLDEGMTNFKLELPAGRTPFNWLYGILGVATISVLVYTLRKRKK